MSRTPLSATPLSSTRQFAFFQKEKKVVDGTTSQSKKIQLKKINAKERDNDKLINNNNENDNNNNIFQNIRKNIPAFPPSPSAVKDMPVLLSKEMDLDEKERELAGALAGAELSLEQKLLVPLLVAAGAVLSGAAVVASNPDVIPDSFALAQSADRLSDFAATLSADPQGTLQSTLEGLGPMGIVYFGLLYVVAELFALPATPLTLSAGALFGLPQGILVVLAAGALSAAIGFSIGKTFLRDWVETVLEENPKFKKLDAAIGAEGFKLLVLVRLSPIFPFSLLNYTYGASSIKFPTFVAGTLLGFTPSTIGYVYAGLVGKDLLMGQGDQPWYVYAAGLATLLAVLKTVTDVATEIVEAIDEE